VADYRGNGHIIYIAENAAAHAITEIVSAPTLPRSDTMLANFQRIISALTICAMIFGCASEPLPTETTSVPTQFDQPTTPKPIVTERTPEPTPAPTHAPTLSLSIDQVPDWIKSYYERYDGISITSGILYLIDLNFDGVPELLQSYFSTGGYVYSGAFTVVDGEAVEIPDIRWKGMRSNLSDYHSLWLVVDNGVRKWLSVSENFDPRDTRGNVQIDLTDCSELPEVKNRSCSLRVWRIIMRFPRSVSTEDL
jgi:hypothetical protein